MSGSATSASLRDRVLGLLRATKRPLVAVGMGAAFDSRAVRLLRRRVFRVRASDVVAVVDALEGTGLRCWLAGGWGIDALLGQQSRRHNDLDLCVEVTEGGEAVATAALARLGYAVAATRAESGLLFPVRTVCRDRSGRTIDLLLVGAPGGPPPGEALPVLEPAAVTTGRIAGREVGCLAADLQLQAHTGYIPQDRDRLDVGLLCAHLGIEPPPAYRLPGTATSTLPARARHLRGLLVQLIAPSRAATAVVVPVPAAQGVVSACGGVGPGDLPAHVTVLFPFVPSGRLTPRDERELARLVASVPGFGFRLAEISSFPGTVYLAPEPPEPFLALTEVVTRHWPAFPPYAGAFDAVVPHVTLGHGVTPADLAPTVMPHLPIHADATEVVLMARDRLGSWAPKWRFPLDGGVSR